MSGWEGGNREGDAYGIGCFGVGLGVMNAKAKQHLLGTARTVK